ncbi:TetR/AcrR family transcriptional regulator [Eubacteriales bacterium OttesenSCG-928-K08]|nr:TetR/AcrR family transcriptional regulator [Eubacteriales bacterium OttesenSCG-928-K08]
MEFVQSEFASELFLRIDQTKRDRILSVAVEEFASFGYSGANVNRIAQSAGISVGALYKYFATKNDLFLYIVEVAFNRMTLYVEQIIHQDSHVFEKLEHLLRLAKTYSLKDPVLIRLYSVFTSESDEARAGMIAQKIEGVTSGAYRELIRLAQEKGEIRNDIDPGVLAFLVDNQLISMQFSFACFYYRKRFSMFVGAQDDEQSELVIKSIIKALKSMLEP